MRNGTLAAAARTEFADGEWHVWASCRGESTETFYLPDDVRGSARRLGERRAKQICESCPVLVSCRRHAVDVQEPHGIWGGTTPEERGELRRGGRLS